MAGKLNPLNKKCKKDNLKMQQVKNDNLQCEDCLYKLDDTGTPCNTSKCEKFPKMKPVKVLSGGECDEYIEE